MFRRINTHIHDRLMSHLITHLSDNENAETPRRSRLCPVSHTPQTAGGVQHGSREDNLLIVFAHVSRHKREHSEKKVFRVQLKLFTYRSHCLN